MTQILCDTLEQAPWPVPGSWRPEVVEGYERILGAATSPRPTDGCRGDVDQAMVGAKRISFLRVLEERIEVLAARREAAQGDLQRTVRRNTLEAGDGADLTERLTEDHGVRELEGAEARYSLEAAAREPTLIADERTRHISRSGASELVGDVLSRVVRLDNCLGGAGKGSDDEPPQKSANIVEVEVVLPRLASVKRLLPTATDPLTVLLDDRHEALGKLRMITPQLPASIAEAHLIDP